MFRERRLLLVIPALAILSLAVGCGGGKQSVTAVELGQKADQACRTERTKFRQIQATPPANATEAADQTKALISVAESTSSTIDDLDPPEGVRSVLDVYLGAREQAIEQMRRGQGAAENQDSRGYGDAQAAVVKSAPQRRRLAQSLGFQVCSASAKAI